MISVQKQIRPSTKVKIPPKQRDGAIDMLRGLSILLVILLHIVPYYLQYPISQWLWSWGQWVVPAFILCSIAVNNFEINSWSEYFAYILKRLKRLLIPYYLWLFIYTLMQVYIGHKSINLKYFFQNITLTGGTDFNWLVLLFVYLTIALPIIQKIIKKSEIISVIGIIITAMVSVYFIWNRPYLAGIYRFSMIIPWYGIAIALLLFLKWFRSKHWWKIALLIGSSFGVFVVSYQYFLTLHQSLNTYYHKYPPDIYYYSFCLWTVPVVYIMTWLVSRPNILPSPIKTAFQYVSQRSYSLFFIHILVLFVLDVKFPTRPFSYLSFCIITFIITFILMVVIDYVSSFFKSLTSKEVVMKR